MIIQFFKLTNNLNTISIDLRKDNKIYGDEGEQDEIEEEELNIFIMKVSESKDKKIVYFNLYILRLINKYILNKFK